MNKESSNKKNIQVVGGVGETKWGNTQYKQQHRVIDKGLCSYSICQGLIVVITVRRWEQNR